MKRRQIHSYIFWPSGLISLVCLPLLLSWHVIHTPAAYTKATLFVIHGFDYLTVYAPEFDIPPKGTWILFTFADDERPSEIEFVRLRDSIRSHVVRRDTTRGIQIHFTRRLIYGDFVRVVDMLEQEKVWPWSIFGTDIWVHNAPRPRRSESAEVMPLTFCGGTRGPDVSRGWDDCLHYQLGLMRFLFRDDVRTVFALCVLMIAAQLAYDLAKMRRRRQTRRSVRHLTSACT